MKKSGKGLLDRLLHLLKELIFYLVIPAFIMVVYLMQPVWIGERSTAEKLASQSRLMAHVQTISEKLPKRSADPDNLEPTARYIFAELSKYSGHVVFKPFTVDGEVFKNIYAYFGPKDNGAPLYIVGAHYDSESGNPGADDNASGVAGVLELARLLSISPPKVPIVLAAYALEEPPHFRTKEMGSYQHAKMLFDSKQPVALMIALEMIGFFSDEQDSQAYPFPGMELIYPDKGNFIALVGKLNEPLVMRSFKHSFSKSTDLDVYSINAPVQLPGIDFSDHINFWYFGFPAIMVTDTAFYRNPNYHKSTDTMGKLDFERMAQVVDGLFGALNSLED